MKYTVGYITSWRKALFFTFVFSMMIFGIALSVCGSAIGIGMVSNIICIGVMLVCIVLVLLVYFDKWDRYVGEGTAAFDDESFTYNDRKRHISIPLADIKKVDIVPVKLGEGLRTPIAYSVLIATAKKKYYIESERALGRDYKELDVFNLYLELQKKVR